MMTLYSLSSYSFFFFNDTATTEIYTLSLHDALPISARTREQAETVTRRTRLGRDDEVAVDQREERGQTSKEPRVLPCAQRSEEHTSELQSLAYLVCRLLLEKKKKMIKDIIHRQVSVH